MAKTSVWLLAPEGIKDLLDILMSREQNTAWGRILFCVLDPAPDIL
jgi:hypothetical protein